MDFHIISTGSAGNAVIIEKNILIDAGVSFKKIEPFLPDIKLVLLTHEHSDHFKPSTLRRMALEKPLLRFGCGPFLVKKLVGAGVSKAQIDILQPRMMYGYGICNVIPVEAYHDVPCYGFKLHYPNGKVFYMTDLGNTSGIFAKDYSLYLIEANYKETELKARMDEKMASGEFAYEQRVMKYHLSEKQAIDWLYSQMGKNSEYVFLHQHTDRDVTHESKDS